ncbi:glycoside hydrolase family 30 protein [Flectobacillus roseus]|uniref:Glycoside hydrolase family 30 beta sandwich domain-containing protein n=1 Tax=Flectobacillus roseus TaxID=502259 RepID=A0ABT6Y639_9BACT|nr:glycoside hydrolase family 30 beta sandwich domain-containing protein [Flectobacillus roseus]MDI9858716.1 glycoside hydrolase family 30 beta sandwich domain-containing protein [Flectobacillus roseus]
MKKTISKILLATLVSWQVTHAQGPRTAEVWLTHADQSKLFEKQAETFTFSPQSSTLPTIFVDEKQKFQSMDGFGFTLTGGSATLLWQMDADKRKALLKELFAFDGKNIGISYLRVSIGASDLSDHVFTYNDLTGGQTDEKIQKFDLSEEKKALIPVLKEILAINPAIKILGSPWTPPVWMKTNSNSKGGSLLPKYYDAYALYFVKYIQSMKKEGIHIDAVTIQNEPLHPGNNPSLLMQPEEQGAFIKQSLGKAFKLAKITTKIWLYDHNADRPDYPIAILNDPEVRQYVDGSAFHLYGGSVENIRQVHEAHPDKNLYFTEQWIGAPGNFAGDLAWHTKTLIIGAPRNWCKTVLEWNLAADPQQNPHTDGGCTECLGALTIDKNEIKRNPAYYIVAHASKFVRPNAQRIASNTTVGLQNIAFKTAEGRIVLIVLNESNKPSTFMISHQNKKIQQTLSAGAVATYVW